ncbi:hypothetical protein OEIGOIKO_03418 [Streptomyces chrestomyceticus JCM 4735]|uniref:Uncharacterized protein n=1 Tax=Streptomyces chrestomyceticus JCM 4735 TaxID=1306181 RepID=A0A7U9KVR7_9ACTN|nr:hypothetical protein OEIGOIKO_03418 [Streptomyces chrestomyceticus JCM 4735]
MLPTMATHGCAPQHHRARLHDGVVVHEECMRCAYRISYEAAGRERLCPPPRPAAPTTVAEPKPLTVASSPSPRTAGSTFTGRSR